MPAKRKPGPDPLGTYRAKRALDRPPEPGARPATPGASAGGLFVVHMHAARRLHWDLRLEMDGVLRSWAVPKGPSPNRADKRLAVHVEDHPLEYGEFEGIIPEGNYGAGGVIVWDRGRWVPLEDPEEGMKKGKLLFELHGYKLKGKWTLVKLKKGEKEWLLIKEKDGYAAADGALPPESVLSGLTVEELKAGKDRAAPVVKELARRTAPRRAVAVGEAEPMLAETREQPFSKPGWLFELKLDGYRVRAAHEGGEARLVTRNGHDIAPAFPESWRARTALRYEGFIFDGELVVPDEAGRPSFQRLQNRAKVSRALEVRRAAVETPAVLYVFDLLAFDGYDVRPLPLERRKALLEQIVPRVGPIKYLSHFEKDGEALYEQVVKMGLEGIVAKKADSPYRAGRSPNWLKIRADRADDFVVVGFTRPKGSRSGFGALDLGAYENGKLVYAGRVGSGFTAAQLKEVSAALERGVRPTPAFTGPVPQDPGHTWVEPTLVVEVRYKEWTDEGLLRQPVFLRFRDDKKPEDCVIDRARSREQSEPMPDPSPSRTAPGSVLREVKFSNLDKVFWPEERYTKGDLIEYYRTVSKWILDLDPKEAPFTDVVTVAKAVQALCDDIGLPTGIKTSGSTGLHVLIPLGRQVTYEQSRTLGGLLARVIAAELPEIATVTRQVQKRDGKVYLDYVQNGHGRLLVAPFSARPLPGAPVSMPLRWSEVTPKLDIRKFTIKTAPARMQKLEEDPLHLVLELKPDLVEALEQLHGRVG